MRNNQRTTHFKVPEQVSRAITVANLFYQIVIEKLGTTAQSYLGFPRNIEKLVTFSFEIPLRSIPQLSLQAASEYLCILRGESELDTEEMPRQAVWGLLHVGSPATMILVEERLAAHIRNYVIAHELGHYLYDVFMVQQLWLRSFPEQHNAILQAFTWQSVDPWLELGVFLKKLPQRPQTITARGQDILYATKPRELFANAIALELLAPWQQATALFKRYSQSEVIQQLIQQYALPKSVAYRYYNDLAHVLVPQSDLFDRLFAPVLHQTQSKNNLDQ